MYFTTRAWNLTTHAIDPDVDEARHYLIEDLLTAECIETFGLIGGVGEATEEDPHRNLMFAPWWTDGRRVILHLAEESERVPLGEVGFFEFYEFGQRINEVRGMKLESGTAVAEPEGAPVIKPTGKGTSPR